MIDGERCREPRPVIHFVERAVVGTKRNRPPQRFFLRALLEWSGSYEAKVLWVPARDQPFCRLESSNGVRNTLRAWVQKAFLQYQIFAGGRYSAVFLSRARWIDRTPSDAVRARSPACPFVSAAPIGLVNTFGGIMGSVYSGNETSIPVVGPLLRGSVVGRQFCSRFIVHQARLIACPAPKG